MEYLTLNIRCLLPQQLQKVPLSSLRIASSRSITANWNFTSNSKTPLHITMNTSIVYGRVNLAQPIGFSWNCGKKEKAKALN
jgi:hypothetical protein